MAVFRARWATRRWPHHAPQQPLAGFLAGRDLGAAACAEAPELINSLPSTRVEILRRANSALLRMTTQTKRLPLGELEALARALLAVLLAFLHAGIAGQKAVLAKSGTQFRVEEADGAGQSHAHRAGLPADAATLGGGNNVNLFRDAAELERFDGVVTPGVIGKILIDFAAIHRELAGAGPQEHARHGFLAASRAEKPILCAHYNGRFHCTQCSSSKTCWARLLRVVASTSRLDCSYLRHHLERNTYVRKTRIGPQLRWDQTQSEIGCGFCPAWRAKPSASR